MTKSPRDRILSSGTGLLLSAKILAANSIGFELIPASGIRKTTYWPPILNLSIVLPCPSENMDFLGVEAEQTRQKILQKYSEIFALLKDFNDVLA